MFNIFKKKKAFKYTVEKKQTLYRIVEAVETLELLEAHIFAKGYDTKQINYIINKGIELASILAGREDYTAEELLGVLVYHNEWQHTFTDAHRKMHHEGMVN